MTALQDRPWLQLGMGILTLAFSIYLLIFYSGRFKLALFTSLFLLSLGFLWRYKDLRNDL